MPSIREFGKGKTMKVALTGATGFIGKYIAREFMKPGDAVRALVRPTSDVAFLKSGGAELVTGDFGDDAAMQALIRGADALVHNGYWHDRNELQEPMKWFELNVLSSLKMLEWCRRAGVRRYLFISTGAVYGEKGVRPLLCEAPSGPTGKRGLTPFSQPLDEMTGAFPRGGYAAYNRAVEVYVDAYRGEFDMAGSTSIRLCGRNIGVHRKLDMCPWLDLLRAGLRGDDLRVSGMDQFDCCVDIARNLRLLLTKPMEKVEEVYCFADDARPMREIAEALVRGLGSRSRVIEEPAREGFVGTSNARLKAAGGTFSGPAGIEAYAREMLPILKSR